MVALEVFAKADLPYDRALICGYATFEEIRQLLHILQIHEAEWVFNFENGSDSKPLKARIGDVTQILTHVSQR
jgi:hypothetical protein